MSKEYNWNIVLYKTAKENGLELTQLEKNLYYFKVIYKEVLD